MSFLREVKGWLGLDPDSVTAPSAVSTDRPLFVYVMLPGNIQPMERGRFEDPLAAELERSGLGQVTGGGSQLDDPDEHGNARVAFAGIDIDLYAVQPGLDLLVRELRRLDARDGTVLLYELGGTDHELRVHE